MSHNRVRPIRPRGRRRRRRLSLQVENLEPRYVLTSLWQNPINALDVNDDAYTSPMDAVLIIDKINLDGVGPLSAQLGEGEGYTYYDVNGNEYLDALDVLIVIDWLNGGFTLSSSDNPSGSVDGQAEAEAGSNSERPTIGENVVEMRGEDLVVGGSSRHEAFLFTRHGSDQIDVFINGKHWGPYSVTGRLIALGRGGNDSIVAAHDVELPVVFYGDEGHDVLIGAKGRDVLVGGPGNDALHGNDGSDYLDGGDGRDGLFGYRGNDWLRGGAGNDVLYAHQGNDLLEGGSGKDILHSHSGDDILRGGDGNDTILGFSGNDILLGGDGDDSLMGHEGRDLLVGGSGAEQLFGHGDDDVLIGGTTAYDGDNDALRAILGEWTSGSSFSTRVGNLVAGSGGAVGFPLQYSGTTVFDDGVKDEVFGGIGSDWSLIGPTDRVFGAEGRDRTDVTTTMPGETPPPSSPPTGAESTNVAVTTDPGVQQMPSVAVNPLDANHVVIAYMDYSLATADGETAGEGYAGIGVAISRDGGDTWQHTSIPLPANFDQGAANPIAKFDDQGRLFVSFMAATFLGETPPLTNPDFWNAERGASDREFGFQANNGVFVARSDDGGLNWNEPVAVVSHLYEGDDVFFEVIPDLAIDTFATLPDGQLNPNYGNLYVTWTRLYPPGRMPGAPDNTGGGELMIAISHDVGLTWETQLKEKDFWVDINADGVQQDEEVTTEVIGVLESPIREFAGAPPGLSFLDQARVVVGPEGDVSVSAFAGGNFTVHHSTDGGATFVGPDFADERWTVFGTDFDSSVDPEGLPGNHFRTHTVRAIAADINRPGRVYAVEPLPVTGSDGSLADDADVFFARSTDYGESWETTFSVGPNTTSVLNDDNGGRLADGAPDDVVSGQALPRMTVDNQGNLGVIWYDTRRDPADHLLDVFGAVSTDGGETFSRNFRLSDVSIDADAGAFTNAVGGQEYYLGDFIGLAMSDNTGYAAWTDTRNGNQDIFFTSFAIDPPPEPLNDRFEPNDTPDLTASPTVVGKVVQRILPKLAVPPGDDDWFLVEAAATGELIASALYDDPSSVPAGALGLELWDAAATTLLGTGADLVDQAGDIIGREIRSVSNAGQQFLIHVVGLDSSQTVPYSLRLQSLTADLGTRVYVNVDGSLESGGGALYRVAAAASGSIEVQLTGGDNVEGDLNVSVLDPKTFAVLASGQAPLGPPTSAASSEPNDSIGQANATNLVGPGLVTVDSFIGDGDFGTTSGDMDFFSFQAAASQRITIDVDPLGSELDSMIALYDSAGNAVQLVDNGGPSDAESLTYVTERVDTYYAAVMAWETDFPSDPFTPGSGAGAGTTGDFRLTITVEDVGAGATKQASLPVQKGQGVLLLVSGDGGSSGNFTLAITNPDQFTTEHNAALLFPAGADPSSTVIADLDDDGADDLIVANAFSNSVSVLLGNGNGTFRSPRQFAVGAYSDPGQSPWLARWRRDVAVADLDSDGNMDVVVTNFASSDVSVLLGRGDGTFQPQRRFDATPAPWGLDIGDINGDQIPDVVVIDAVHGASTVAVLLGRGDGTFAPQSTFTALPTAAFPIPGIRLADLNGDAKLDLIVSGDNTPGVDIYLGNGDGTFTFEGRFDANREAADTEVSDLDGDGNVDVIVASSGEQGELSVLMGNGDGTFQSAQNYFAGQDILDVEVVDFGRQTTLADGSVVLGPPDGTLDLVAAASGAPRSVQVVGGPEVVILPGIVDDAGNFAGFGAPLQLAPGKTPLDVDSGDLNNDGSVDLVVVDRDGVLVIFGKPPVIPANTMPETARDLGTVVHFVDQTQTIIPGREDAYYRLTVPTEAVEGAGDEIIDFSLGFEHPEGPGLGAEVLDSAGNVLGSGERFRVRARQGEELLLHVYGLDGSVGYGAFTPVIDVLPQVVSAESHALLPGVSGQPGGPTTSIVLTFQGDRLDPATAEDPTHYTVTWLGPDRLAGTADDQEIAVGGGLVGRPVVYNASANVEPTTGKEFATAVRQTVTLLFSDPLPPGSYLIELSPEIQSAAFNAEEAGLLSQSPDMTGHPVVSLEAGELREGSRLAAVDLVMESVGLGDLTVLSQGSAFLTQAHDNLGALLDSLLTERGDDPTITTALIDQVLARFDPALGPLGQRAVRVMVIWLDPVDIEISDPDDERIIYDTDEDILISEPDDASVDVSDNIEVIVISLPIDEDEGSYDLTVEHVSETARGGVVMLTDDENLFEELTDDLRSGETSFTFTF